MTTAFDSAPDGASYRLNTAVLLFALRILGLSQVRFAKAIGVDQSTASRMLSGSPTTAAVARKIHATIPGLTIPEIVDLPGLSPGLPIGADPRVHDHMYRLPGTFTVTCVDHAAAAALGQWLSDQGSAVAYTGAGRAVMIPWGGDPRFVEQVYDEVASRGWADDEVNTRERAAALASLTDAR